MICPKCKEQQHKLCRGGTWCDCQHKVPQPMETRILPSGSPAASGVVTQPKRRPRKAAPRRSDS
jgi:hypothetical protein